MCLLVFFTGIFRQVRFKRGSLESFSLQLKRNNKPFQKETAFRFRSCVEKFAETCSTSEWPQGSFFFCIQMKSQEVLQVYSKLRYTKIFKSVIFSPYETTIDFVVIQYLHSRKATPYIMTKIVQFNHLF